MRDKRRERKMATTTSTIEPPAPPRYREPTWWDKFRETPHWLPNGTYRQDAAIWFGMFGSFIFLAAPIVGYVQPTSHNILDAYMAVWTFLTSESTWIGAGKLVGFLGGGTIAVFLALAIFFGSLYLAFRFVLEPIGRGWNRLMAWDHRRLYGKYEDEIAELRRKLWASNDKVESQLTELEMRDRQVENLEQAQSDLTWSVACVAAELKADVRKRGAANARVKKGIRRKLIQGLKLSIPEQRRLDHLLAQANRVVNGDID